MLNKFYGGILPDVKRLDFEKILNVIGEDIAEELGSAINSGNFLTEFMTDLKDPIDIIEIGTFIGIGTALIASYSRSVFTFDIYNRNSHHIWNALNVAHKINCYTGEQSFIDDVISDLKGNKDYNFNFAFIDGMHTYDNVKHDFNLVKFCGRVLFHDAHLPEIKRFIDEIGGRIVGNNKEPSGFGYWEK